MEKEPRSSDITEEGSLHPYRTEIPNTVVRGMKSRGLSIYAKWLYVYLKSRAGDGGKSTCSTTTIATESGMSRGQVSAAKQELAKSGLITISPGKNPRRHSDQIRIKNIWLLNMQEFSVQATNTEEDDNGKDFQGDKRATVHNTNTEKGTPKPSVHDMNSLNKAEPLAVNEDKPSSVHMVNTEESAVFTTRTQCSQYEQGVHSMNQRRSQEEDPKKNNTPYSLSDARADTRDLERFESRFSPAPTTRCPTDFVPNPDIRQWAQASFPSVDFDEALGAMKDYEFQRPRSDWNAALKTWIRREAKEFAGRTPRATQRQGYVSKGKQRQDDILSNHDSLVERTLAYEARRRGQVLSGTEEPRTLLPGHTD